MKKTLILAGLIGLVPINHVRAADDQLYVCTPCPEGTWGDGTMKNCCPNGTVKKSTGESCSVGYVALKSGEKCPAGYVEKEFN